MATAKGKGIEVIEATEVSVAPRGRKAVLDPVLTEAFATLPAGKAARLTMFGQVTDKDTRAKIGGVIRKNWRAVRADDCRINWGTDGVAQVMVRPEKADA
jgi:hypothetical protein